MEEIINKLRDDNHYYGDLGRRYISASDVGTLINSPSMFKADSKKTKAIIEGSYLHAIILEPHKIGDQFVIVDCASRNTTIYKEAVIEHEDKDLLLKAEAENMKACANALLGNFEIHSLIRSEGTIVEEPMIKNIYGNWWKGKRDIGNKLTIDIKTTSDISKFKSSAYRYNYDSQAWVYEELFGCPVIFVVVDKITHQVGIFTCSDDFLKRGEEKVIKATHMYNKYYGDDSTEDVNNFIIRDTL